MRAHFLEGFLEVGVHVTDNRLGVSIHSRPICSVMRSRHDLLFLAVQRSRIPAVSMSMMLSGIAVSVMQLELINAEETRRLLRVLSVFDHQ